MQAFIDGYIDCALWSSQDWRAMDEAGEANPDPLDDNYGPEDLESATRSAMEADCVEFVRANFRTIALVIENLDGYTWASAGHDFWLTRNGHGAGYWDRYYGPFSELRSALLRLSEAAKAYGEVDLDSTPQGTVQSF